jgi:CheY-like chemotaxis protein
MVIVYVDDDSDDLELMEEALREIDPAISCRTFISGREALDYLESASAELPDFIFLDINMPLMDGKECFQEIKASKRLRAIPVIMLSTTPVTREMKPYFHLGVYDFIVKPPAFDKLCEALASILRSKE